MKRFLIIVLIGAFTVIVFDTFGSMASYNLNFPYVWLTVGSALIYVWFGLAASKLKSVWYAALAGGILGLIDSTLGWYISQLINLGRPTGETELTIFAIISTITFVTLLGAILGFIGGLIGRIIQRS